MKSTDSNKEEYILQNTHNATHKNSPKLNANSSNSENIGDNQTFNKIVPKPPDGKRTRKHISRKNLKNKKESLCNDDIQTESKHGQPIDVSANKYNSVSNFSQKKLQFNDNVNSVAYSQGKTNSISNVKLQDHDHVSGKERAQSSSKTKPNLFHLSLNESTFSLMDEPGEYLEMSSGLIVNKKRPNYDLHISIDESSEMNQSAAFIRDQIFDHNNEWNVETTSPGRYMNENIAQNKENNNIKQDQVDSMSDCVNDSNIEQKNPEWSKCHLYFLYNEVMGLICKPCFSITCEHCKILSSAQKDFSFDGDTMESYDNMMFEKDDKNHSSPINLLDKMNQLLKNILLVKHNMKIIKISESFVYKYEDSDIIFNEVVIEVTGMLASSVWEHEYSKLTTSSLPNDKQIYIDKNKPQMDKSRINSGPLTNIRRNSKAESLCYDSDYDDCSYLRSCTGNASLQYGKRNSNNSLRVVTPPLTCSSPTNDKVIEEKIRKISITDKPFQLETVFEGKLENSVYKDNSNDNDKDSLDGEDKTKSNESLFSNLSDSLNESTSPLHKPSNIKNTQTTDANFSNNKNNMPPNNLLNSKTLSQNSTLKKQKKAQKTFNMEAERPDDNLTTKELKEFARKELFSQLKREYNISNPNDLNMLNNSTTGAENELDSEDELQWFLQEKRKRLLTAELFSSGSSDMLPEDDEVRRINLQSIQGNKVSEELKNLNDQITNDSTAFQSKSTNTESINIEQDFEEFQLDDSIGSAIDSGLDSHTSISNSRSNDADSQQVISARTNYLRNYPPNDDVHLIFTRFDERMSKRSHQGNSTESYFSYFENNPSYYHAKYPKPGSHLIDNMNRIRKTVPLNIPISFKENSRRYPFQRTQSANKNHLKQSTNIRTRNSFSHHPNSTSSRSSHGIFRNQNTTKYNLQKGLHNQYGIKYTHNAIPNSNELIILGQHIYQRKRKP